MNDEKLMELGFNKNEAKVYLTLLSKGSAIASELVKITGVHRNIIYDNLDKLIQKGLVSYINEGSKKIFVAEKSNTLLEYIETKQKEIDEEREKATKLIPEINSLLESSKSNQDATLFRGRNGIKKIILDTLNSKEYWVMGVSNASVELLGDIFWKNFNVKRKAMKIKENLLFNRDFKNTVNIQERGLSKSRRLPNELNQITEIFLYNNKAAIIVYSEDPISVVIENENVFQVFKQQFEFLWKLSK